MDGEYSRALKVHVMPHSHMDISWLDGFIKTYNDHVRQIYTNVVLSLVTGSQRTFVFAETAFIR